jgi:predicted dinucleotide-binding enzyme
MNIGIIGAGGIATAFAQQVLKAGHQVTLSNSRGPESLAGVVRELGAGARAGTRQQAAEAEIVLVAVPWQQLPAALADLPPWAGRIVIDANNPVLQPGFRLAELGGRNSSQVFADLVPGARVVKAVNTLPVAVLAADPQQSGGKRVLFVSGDEAAAKAEVVRLLQALGFATIDLGPLAVGGVLQQFPGGPLPALNLLQLG